MADETIYHITTAGEWQAAQTAGAYLAMSLASEGFMHASTAAQLLATAELHYKDDDDLVVLVIDLTAVNAEVRYEASRSGALFPHVYGALNLDAVTNVLRLTRDADGAFVWPSAPFL